ncbi:MAG: hypothetical protein WD939_08215, partial [Dehalococcoidia bacterium]
MAQEAHNLDVSSLTNELDEALTTLDSALLQAGRSVSIIRANVAQFAQLGEAVREMESAMARARDQLSGSWGIAASPGSPQLHAVPAPTQVLPQPAQPAPQEPSQAYESAYSEQPIAATEPYAGDDAPEGAGEPQDDDEPPAPQPDANIAAARCLRLGVSSKGGSLDLKAVDGSVNENPSVVDVALLDYDGRHATLKLWINDSADPNGVRDALIS